MVPSILDLRNVSFLQQPSPSCSPGVEAVVVVLSAPANTHRRDKLRGQFRGVVAHARINSNSIPYYLCVGVPISQLLTVGLA